MTARKGFKPSAVYRAWIFAVALAMTVGTIVGTGSPAKAAVNCYVQKAGWQMENRSGMVIGKPAFEIHWCTNRRGGRVASAPYFQCWDNGGFAFYEGCKHAVGGFGNSSLGIEVHWHWLLGFDSVNLAIYYYCRYSGYVTAAGTASGWITCDYGKGF